MNDIASLESRITAALDRIRQGIESTPAPQAAVAAPKVASDDDSDLQAQLEQARTQAAHSQDRVRRVKNRARAAQQAQAEEIAALTARLDAQNAQLQALDGVLQQLRASNVQLREMNTALRAAVTEGLTPELVDAARDAEMTALQTQRSADAAELDAIVAALGPLIKETANAAD